MFPQYGNGDWRLTAKSCIEEIPNFSWSSRGSVHHDLRPGIGMGDFKTLTCLFPVSQTVRVPGTGSTTVYLPKPLSALVLVDKVRRCESCADNSSVSRGTDVPSALVWKVISRASRVKGGTAVQRKGSAPGSDTWQIWHCEGNDRSAVATNIIAAQIALRISFPAACGSEDKIY
jgi:hypothetical protein